MQTSCVVQNRNITQEVCYAAGEKQMKAFGQFDDVAWESKKGRSRIHYPGTAFFYTLLIVGGFNWHK